MKEILVDAHVLISFLTDRNERQREKAAVLLRGASAVMNDPAASQEDKDASLLQNIVSNSDALRRSEPAQASRWHMVIEECVTCCYNFHFKLDHYPVVVGLIGSLNASDRRYGASTTRTSPAARIAVSSAAGMGALIR